LRPNNLPDFAKTALDPLFKTPVLLRTENINLKLFHFKVNFLA